MIACIPPSTSLKLIAVPFFARFLLSTNPARCSSLSLSSTRAVARLRLYPLLCDLRGLVPRLSFSLSLSLPLFWGTLAFSGRRMAINPARRSWGPGLLKLLYGSEPKSEGLPRVSRFQREQRARVHTHAYTRQSFPTPLPVLC